MIFIAIEIIRGLNQEVMDSLMKDEELLQQNARFDSALNNMAQGLMMMDAEGRVLVSMLVTWKCMGSRRMWLK